MTYSLLMLILVISGVPGDRSVVHAEMVPVDGFSTEDRCELAGDGLRREFEGMSTKTMAIRMAWGCARKT